MANFYNPTPWLAFDADVSFARARFLGVTANATRIPGALENVVAAGVTVTPSSSPLSGSIRLRRFGAYPLVEDNSVRARPSNLVSAEAGLRLPAGTRLQLTVLNALNGRAEDIQYFYTSRLRGDPAVGVDGVHSHPVEPRQLRVSLEHALR
jgi:hypothetical protein